jgi:hypothetical protein
MPLDTHPLGDLGGNLSRRSLGAHQESGVKYLTTVRHRTDKKIRWSRVSLMCDAFFQFSSSVTENCYRYEL